MSKLINKIAPSQYLQVVRSYRDGLPIKEMARIYRVSPAAVYRILKNSGVTIERYHRPEKPYMRHPDPQRNHLMIAKSIPYVPPPNHDQLVRGTGQPHRAPLRLPPLIGAKTDGNSSA